uniref:Peptidase_M1 domain-containing protein n=1 Tax=Panagrellus redivivus TaxID=6233 RepID=A0A7E4W3F0_PANRE
MLKCTCPLQTSTMLVFGGLLLLLGIFAFNSSATDEDALIIIPLPRALQPTSYELSVEVLLPPFDAGIGNVTFQNNGVVTIELKAIEETDKIVLNAANISITRCRLVNINGKDASTELTNITYDVPSQLVTIMSPFKFAINDTFQLAIDYSFVIRNDSCGMFNTPYQEGNVTHNVVQTDFEAINARRLVPCFDDPSFRSKWTVEVKAPIGYTVLSNTEKASDPNPAGPGFTLTRFNPTPPIPSYLLAIAVHDYPYLENVTSTGILYRFYGQQSKLDVCSEAFEFTGRLIDHLIERFKVVKFPSTKVDFIETERHPSGGMENFGLITLNAKIFCNVTDMPRFKNIIIHELIHQWFGNIVTMKDWSNAIMNEGLTEYYTELVVKELLGLCLVGTPSYYLWKYVEIPLEATYMTK